MTYKQSLTLVDTRIQVQFPEPFGAGLVPHSLVRGIPELKIWGFLEICYNDCIYNKNTKYTMDELIVTFFEKGGRINKFYLRKRRNGPTLVYLNGWYRGRNISDAILRAFAGQ